MSRAKQDTLILLAGAPLGRVLIPLTLRGAVDPIGAETIAAMAHGEQVLATIKRARNPAHHRKLFAMLQIVLENQEKYRSLEDLLNAVKIGTGHCQWGTVWLKGIPAQVAIPKSISFANLGQGKFEEFYRNAVDFILAEVIPGATKRGD